MTNSNPFAEMILKLKLLMKSELILTCIYYQYQVVTLNIPRLRLILSQSADFLLELKIIYSLLRGYFLFYPSQESI